MGLTQRSASQCLSATDVAEAEMAGAFALAQAVAGETGKMIVFRREEGADYRLCCELAEVGQICNQEKLVPPEWLSSEQTDVAEPFLSYLLPLIQGDIKPPVENGLPKFLIRK